MKNQLGIPAVIAAIIIACVVGGVVGTRDSGESNKNARNAAPPSASDAASAKLSAGRYTNKLADDTWSDKVPVYGSGVRLQLVLYPLS